jgi:hypothetical protein
MTWIIRVEHIDDKTGECLSAKKGLTDLEVKQSNLDVLDLSFRELTDTVNAQLAGEKK